MRILAPTRLRLVLAAAGLVAEGEDRRLDAVLQAEFGEDAADVGLDGLRAEFLAEATLLSLAGGAAGVIIGAITTAAYARGHGEAVVIPSQACAGALAAAVITGAPAGLLPAIHAARLSPTQALWSI